MAKCNSCVHFYVCEKYDATVDFDVDDGVCLYYEKKVVRCKDCGYWIHVEDGYGECTNRRFHLDGHPDPTMEFNGFCSCGERREGE